jgi:hypothetical protein
VNRTRSDGISTSMTTCCDIPWLPSHVLSIIGTGRSE